MPVDGQLGTANDGTPVVWVAALNRAVPVPAAKALGVRPGRPAGAAVDPAAFKRSQDSVAAIDEAKQRTNWFRTGPVGAVTAKIPGSPAYNLDKDLDTLKARSAFEELAAMRRNSPTGGALGGIAVRELDLLQASEANLDVGQGEGQLDKNLDRMRRTVTTRTPGLDASSPIDLTPELRGRIPEGAYFRASDGKVYRQQKGAGAPGKGAGVGDMSDDDLRKALGL